ncbi:MAG: transcription termination/antitermination protein NusA [Deltaproteobacteria bacterium]|nr:transcription termination/antitermination protein NusA [Deltaproteobacteria bacterium]
MFINLNAVIEQVRKDKGISRDIVIDAVESAMVSAARRKYGHEAELEAQYNEEAGEVELFQFKNVVDEVEEPGLEMTLEEAHKLDPDAQVGDELGQKLDSHQFGRIAAQTAKQVIIQKIRDAEGEMIYNEYKDRVGELINGIVRRIEKGNIIVDLGRTEALLPISEQVPSENYRIGDRIQALFLEIRQSARGPQIILSRKRPELIKALFMMEVPEISEGIVEIKNISREVGNRAKVAVYSRDGDVDPVGACVGMKGSRVQSVVQELRGEKIDIVTWDEDPARFICNAIAPAEVVKVILHEKDHSMEIVVPDDQLSLAIGRKGQNVRLAAQLTGWNIDIFSESRYEDMAQHAKKTLVLDLNIEDSMASLFYSHTFRKVRNIAETPLAEFLTLPGINPDLLTQIHERACEVMRLEERERPSTKYFRELEAQSAAIEQKAREKAAEVSSIEASQDNSEASESDSESELTEEAIDEQESSEEVIEESVEQEEKVEEQLS